MKFQSRWFWVAAAVLVALNAFVYFWWANRPLVILKTTELNRDIVTGLQSEANRLQQILDAACGTPGLESYKRGEIGPVQPVATGAPTTPPPEPSASLLAQDKLVALLDAATVRVLVFSASNKYQGHGTGFFIDQNTIVTNRHVIESGRSFAITSRALGKEPIPVRLIAATRDSEYTNPDFAILRADKVPAGIAKLAIATEPQVLQTVVAAGYPSSDIRVDADVVDNLIDKQENVDSVLSKEEVEQAKNLFEFQVPDITLTVEEKGLSADFVPKNLDTEHFVDSGHWWRKDWSFLQWLRYQTGNLTWAETHIAKETRANYNSKKISEDGYYGGNLAPRADLNATLSSLGYSKDMLEERIGNTEKNIPEMRDPYAPNFGKGKRDVVGEYSQAMAKYASGKKPPKKVYSVRNKV